MQQSCSITGNVSDVAETAGPRICAVLAPAKSVSAPLTAALTPDQGESHASPAKVHSGRQSALGGIGKQPANGGRGLHDGACKKSGTKLLIEKRGLPFAVHHEQSGNPGVFRNQACDPDMAFLGGFRLSQYTMPSRAGLQRASMHPSSDGSLAAVPVHGSSKALTPPKPAEALVPAVRNHDRGGKADPTSRPEWDTTPATDIPELPSRPKSAFPRSTPPPRVSASRSTPPVQRRGSPARIRQPNSPSNVTRAKPTKPSKRAQSLMPHRTPPRVTPPSQHSAMPIRGTPSRGTPHAAKQRNTSSGEPQDFEDTGVITLAVAASYLRYYCPALSPAASNLQNYTSKAMLSPFTRWHQSVCTYST